MKSFASFYGQFNKALRCISHRLVSLLATLLYTSSIYSISNRGKWVRLSRIGALPPGQKCIVAAARECLSV